MPDEEITAAAEEQPKKTNKERLKEITDSIEAGIKEVFESDKYRNYLDTMSRFHSYSVNNTMLIYMQKPDATLVAGFNKWHDKFGRNVKRGEHGIKIIAPTPYKKKVEEQKLDPDTKTPLFDKEGKPIIEEKTVQIPMIKTHSSSSMEAIRISRLILRLYLFLNWQNRLPSHLNMKEELSYRQILTIRLSRQTHLPKHLKKMLPKNPK